MAGQRDEIARAIAADIGQATANEVDSVLRATARGERKRGLADTLAVAAFIVQAVQLGLEIWRTKKDRDTLIIKLEATAKTKPQFEEEIRLDIISRVVDKIAPERIVETARSVAAESPKQEFIRRWLESHQGAPPKTTSRRYTSNPILVPFANMDYYALHRHLQWVPPPKLASTLVEVIVPKGFVTDLASVPRVFWAIIAPTGRHGHAAILHDWLYWDQSEPRARADVMFDTAMEELGVGGKVRATIYATVRVFGGRAWTKNTRAKTQGERRILRMFPDQPIPWEQWRTRLDVFV